MRVSVLDSNYRIDMSKTKTSYQTNDRIIRKLMLNELDMQYGKNKSVRIIEELGLNHGSARVDIAVLNGVMHGYEIKSDKDTLYRLPEQIKAYNSVFNKMTIVVGARHLEHVINMVPDWWEILLVKQTDNSTGVFQIRSGLPNKHQNSEAIARLLWKNEAVDVLRNLKAERGVVSQPRSVVYERLANTLDTNALQKCVRDILFSRSDWRADLA